MDPKLKMGIVGGGGIGTVHQMAARLDGKIELVAGAFSSNAERSKRSGERLGLHLSRVYGDYRAMAAEEAKLLADERIDWMASLEWPSWRRRSKARQTEGHGRR
jgi:predicted dehydrogenase